jgi:hypothetical protein
MALHTRFPCSSPYNLAIRISSFRTLIALGLLRRSIILILIGLRGTCIDEKVRQIHVSRCCWQLRFCHFVVRSICLCSKSVVRNREVGFQGHTVSPVVEEYGVRTAVKLGFPKLGLLPKIVGSTSGNRKR